MPIAYRCRRCKGPPLPEPPEGRCPNPECGGFYRHERIHVREGDVDGAEVQAVKDGEPISAHDLMASLEGDDSVKKRVTGMTGLDWVFDGGLPMFGAILLCAREGTGKTTLLYELFRKLAAMKVDTLYISTEQSLKDLGRQFSRCGPAPAKHMTMHSEIDRDAIIRCIEKQNPQVVAIDSLHDIENVTDESGFSMASGQPSAVTRVAKEIRRLTAELQFLAFLVGHMNNDGTMAGGSHLRHALDASLVLERSDNKKDPRRILQFQGKSRFGTLGRKALFLMGEAGLTDKGPLREGDDDDDDGGDGGDGRNDKRTIVIPPRNSPKGRGPLN